jgi:hypothetical protein
MEHPLVERLTQHHVRAVFETSAAFFDLSRVATFEDLADRLCRVGEHHDGPLTSIDIEIGAWRPQRTIRTALLCRLNDPGGFS